MSSVIPIVRQYISNKSVKHHGGIAVYFNEVQNYIATKSLNPGLKQSIQSGNHLYDSKIASFFEIVYRASASIAKLLDKPLNSGLEICLHTFKARMLRNAILKSRDNDKDLVYHHMNNFVLPNFNLFFLAQKYRIRMIVTMVDYLDVEFPQLLPSQIVRQRKITRDLLFETSELILPIADFIRDDSIKLNASIERIKVIRWGTDHLSGNLVESPSVVDSFQDERVFVLPAKSWAHKGHLMFLKEFLSSDKNSYHLVFTGDTSDINLEIDKLVARYPDKSYLFSNLGFLPNEDRYKLFKMCSGFVLPSVYEGFGFPYFEAAQLQKPLFCFNTKSYAEYFSQCNNPGVTDSFNYELLNRKVEDFNFIEFIEPLSCMKSAVSQLTWEQCCSELIATYCEFAGISGEL